MYPVQNYVYPRSHTLMTSTWARAVRVVYMEHQRSKGGGVCKITGRLNFALVSPSEDLKRVLRIFLGPSISCFLEKSERFPI